MAFRYVEHPVLSFIYRFEPQMTLMKQCFCLLTALYFPFFLMGQVNVSIVINDAITSTTCEDGFLGGAPDLLWAVNIENEAWVNYPAEGDCFTPLPNQQFSREFPCVGDLPNQVEICFKAFENDGIVFSPISCEIVETCAETICANILLPNVGVTKEDSLSLPDGLTSGGTLYYTIAVDGIDNDRICDAVDLGTLSTAGFIGDMNTIGFNNLCGTNTGDPNPAFDGSISNTFSNDKGVWFSFNSGDTPSGLISIETITDPLGVGDPMVLQVAVYGTTNNSCSGFPRLKAVAVERDNSGYIRTLLECPTPNTNYYILIDGDAGSLETLFGHFGIQIENVEVTEAANRICDASDLGTITENGEITTARFSNFCANRIADPTNSSFTIEKSVWFSFVAPASGHILVEGISDATYKPLDMQLALYESSDGSCNGFLNEVASQYDDEDPNENMEVSCLYGGQTYFLLVDGGIDFDGLFSLRLTDAGDITPITTIDTTLCAGSVLAVGNNIYESTGNFIDTIPLFGGCDSIVFSNLVVLPPLTIAVEQTMVAIGEGAANGIAQVEVAGGTGNYTIEWCNGESTAEATALVGGINCCVTVTDDNGCMIQECIDVDFTDEIIPMVQSNVLACFGDTDGMISFSAANGFPPYDYTWQKADNSNNGAGSLASDGESVSLENLTAGDYLIHISDPFDDTTFTVSILQPDLLLVDLVSQQNASCFGFCDGEVEVAISGGTAPYQLSWNSGASTLLITDLCARPEPYSLTVTDANGCQANFSTVVTEPLEFILSASEKKAVSCFGGLDGEAEISVENGEIASILWNTGQTSIVATGLPLGNYQVSVTNTDGCESTTSVQISQPSAPVRVKVEVNNPISCAGDQDGILKAVVEGPGENFFYDWSSGSEQIVATDLSSGTYQLNVRNEKGCSAQAEFFLAEPLPLSASVSKKDLTCLDPPNGGAIYIDQVAGGTPDYVYSINGGLFQMPTEFQQLEAGVYEVTVQDLAGCEFRVGTSVEPPPVLLVDLGEDLTISLGDSVLIMPTANSQTVTYNWKDLDGVFAEGDNVWLKPTFTKQYTIDAFDTETSCTATDDIVIQVDRTRKVFIPNAFNPASDGGNERLRIYNGVGVVGIKSFRVFTRSGDQVFEQLNFMPNDSEVGWDGTFRGQAMNTGVYVYFAEIEFVDGLTEVFRGDVLLMR